jgi:hypothetical protein
VEINERFTNYLEKLYHTREHGTTGQSPIKRYLQDAKALRKAPSELPEYFRRRENRKVNNDRSVRLDGQLFEAPSGLVGQMVTLRFENYDRIEVFVEEVSKGFLKALDVHVNSRVKRERSENNSGGELFKTAESEPNRAAL